MRKFLALLVAVMALPAVQFAQRNCAANDVLQSQLLQDPGMESRMQDIERFTQDYIIANGAQDRVVVTIPVVVHVVYRNASENISDAQVLSQITVMNNDFRKLNADAANTPSVFTAVDCEVQFCMAQRKPDGTATNGIMRYSSTRTTDWGTNDAVKLPAQGGVAPWDATKYLNIWVCSIGGGILGYAQFPGGSASTDGVVIDYRYYGTTGTATAPFNLGRTGTHEVGHWLNLRHIWGDANCGSDLVSDTPTHNTANYGCPTQPHLSTCTGTPREMTMNYMDYTDDACMYMFSAGQKARMQALFATGGARASLLTSNGCTPPTGGTTCGAASGLSTSSITSSGATLSWAAGSGATSYNVQYKTSAATTWTTTTTTSTSLALTGLTAGTTYNWQVQTVCASGTSAYTAGTNFTTTSTTACTDTYETNETRNTAKTIAINANITARIGTSTDKDYFKFTTTATTGFKVKIELTNLPADYDLVLFRGSTQVGISQNAGTASETITYNTATSGFTYTVYVYGYGGVFNATSCYTLRATVSATNLRGEDEEVAVFEQDMNTGADYLSVNPNPITANANLRFNTDRDEDVNISVLDMMGKVVAVRQESLTKGDNNIMMDMSDFNSGMYIIRVDNGREITTRKVVVNK